MSNERTDRQELIILRACVARVAQATGAQTIVLPLLQAKYKDIAEISKLAKTVNRGWNGLCASIVSRANMEQEKQRATIKKAAQCALDMLKRDDCKITHVEYILYVVSDIIPERMSKLWNITLVAISGGNAYDAGAHNLGEVIKWIDREDKGLNG